MTICGWTFSSINGLDCLRNSPANNTTDVVPSPTYKSNNKLIYAFGLFNIAERDVPITFHILFKEV